MCQVPGENMAKGDTRNGVDDLTGTTVVRKGVRKQFSVPRLPTT